MGIGIAEVLLVMILIVQVIIAVMIAKNPDVKLTIKLDKGNAPSFSPAPRFTK